MVNVLTIKGTVGILNDDGNLVDWKKCYIFAHYTLSDNEQF